MKKTLKNCVGLRCFKAVKTAKRNKTKQQNLLIVGLCGFESVFECKHRRN